MKTVLKHILVGIFTLEAKFLLSRKRPTIIAITGSVGKTATKDAIYAVLKDSVHTRKSQKSFNSDIGVALSVLGLENAWNSVWGWVKNIVDGLFIALFSRQYPAVLVLEMGVDRPGDMKKLTAWVKPDIVILTRFPDVPVHVEYFATPEAVIEEKMQLVRALKTDGILIYNNDDELIRQQANEVLQKSFDYSRYSPSHFTITDDAICYEDKRPVGITCTLKHVDETTTFTVRGSLGVQHAYSYAAAIAVASQFDISAATAAKALEQFNPPRGRMRLIEGTGGVTIIDDSYNASPVAVEKALQTLKEVETVGRKIFVIGDMLELGRFSVREHERVGEQAAGVADILITLGLRARKVAECALDNGMSEKVVFQYDDVERAGTELLQMLKPRDVVLVKASQSIRAEKVVKRLMAHPEEAAKLLARQEKVWQLR